MPVQRKIQPQIISNGKTMPMEDFMALLEEGAKFEKTLDPLFEEFYNHLLEKGLTQKEADRYKNNSESFIGFCTMKFNIKSLDDISRAMLTKHLTKMQTAIGPRGNLNEEIHSFKSFFTFLHKKGHTNKKVLGAFYSAQELKELGIK